MTRDILQDIPTGHDPMRKAQEMMRPELPKRFYKVVSVDEREGRFQVLLDGRPVKTPGKLALALPDREFAEAVASEWDAQVERINPDVMHLTRIANSGIEAVPPKREAVADEIAKYAGADLLVYRAESPQGLADMQSENWDPVLRWAESALGARFTLAGGIMHVAQPEESLSIVRGEVGRHDPLGLAALHTVTSISGSVLLALAVSGRAVEPEAAWTAACVDEDWNIRQWGEDAEATRLRARKRDEFHAACFVLTR